MSTRSQPPTSAPQARASERVRGQPAPPMPANQNRRPASGCEGDELIRDRPPPRRAARARIAPPIAASRGGSPSSSSTWRGRVELGLGHDDGAACAREVPRVLRLVVGRRVRGRDEHAGFPAAASSQTEPPARASDEVGAPRRDAELRRVNGMQHIVAARETRALQLGVVALAAEVQDGRPGRSPRFERELVQAARALAAAEDEHDRRVRRGARTGARASARSPRCDARGIGRPTTRYFSPVARRAGTRGRCVRERRGEPVRETEVRVGLGQRAGIRASRAASTIGPAT